MSSVDQTASADQPDSQPQHEQGPYQLFMFALGVYVLLALAA